MKRQSTFIFPLCVFFALACLKARGLTVTLGPALTDRSQVTNIQQVADGAVLDFGPSALFRTTPRTGVIVPTSWGYWLLAALQVTVTGGGAGTKLLVRSQFSPAIQIRWAPNLNRTDWGDGGYGIDVATNDQVVAVGDNINGVHEIALGIEDRAAPGPRSIPIFITALEN